MSRETGHHEVTVSGGESVRSFVPYPLPPVNPPLDLSGSIDERLRAAQQALLRLEIVGAMVPSIDWFIYAFVRKEAVISSQIEGTQASLVDLLTYEAAEPSATPVAPTADVEEVCNYIDALHYARAELADPRGPPLSMRLLSGTHARLMRGVRGRCSYRRHPTSCPTRSPRWIGTSTRTTRSRPSCARGNRHPGRGGSPRGDDREAAGPLLRLRWLPAAPTRGYGARGRLNERPPRRRRPADLSPRTAPTG